VEQQKIRKIMKTVKCFKNMETAKTLGLKRPQGKRGLYGVPDPGESKNRSKNSCSGGPLVFSQGLE
jgi:hypothetical protein